jgi:hypothetical protein
MPDAVRRHHTRSPTEGISSNRCCQVRLRFWKDKHGFMALLRAAIIPLRFACFRKLPVDRVHFVPDGAFDWTAAKQPVGNDRSGSED